MTGMTSKLALSALPDLPAEIGTPCYARKQITPGILHIGVGNFHRAHQAVYMDDLFNQGRDHDWGIVGAGVRPGDVAVRRALQGQDWLTTVVEMEPGAHSARVTGSMVDFLPVADDPKALIAKIADPRVRILSLTITEGGYCLDMATGRFDPDHPEIKADAANIEGPRYIFGVLVAGLRARRAAGLPPLTIMSCDNIQENGHVAHNAVVGLAELVDPDLAKWIDGEVTFPNSMVDRITPATTDQGRDRLLSAFDIDDAWPVFCEPFRQWVLEDRFAGGRPAWDEVGVTLTDDVAKFELMKIRMLNGGHAAIAYPAALLGIHFVHDAMAHPIVRGFLEKLEREEIIPILPKVPGIDLGDYLDLIMTRFANPEVADTVPRLCQDGSNRQPKFILPSMRDRLAAGQSITGLALESALWCRYCYGETDNGQPIKIDDVGGTKLLEAARAARMNAAAFLELRGIFGDLAEARSFREVFGTALSSLWRDGVQATLMRYIALSPGETL